MNVEWFDCLVKTRPINSPVFRGTLKLLRNLKDEQGGVMFSPFTLNVSDRQLTVMQIIVINN